MKKSHILAIGVIAVAIVIIISTAGDASTYVNFDQAYRLASNGSSTQVHVVGAIVLVILIGLIVYLVFLDRKVAALEKRLSKKQ